MPPAYRARLEQLEGLAARAFRVDDRRNAVIGVDRQELRFELLAGAYVDWDDLVRHAELRVQYAPCGHRGSAKSKLRSSQSSGALCGPIVGPTGWADIRNFPGPEEVLRRARRARR